MADSLLNRTWLRIRYYRAGLPWYGLVLRLVLDCLATLGLKIELFHLVVEGVRSTGPQFESTENYEIAFLEASDMGGIARIPGRNFSEDQLLRRLGEGKRCLGVRYRGEIIAFTWFNLKECTFERHGLFPLQENEAHLFDAYTVESFRGKNLQPYMRYRCYEELAKLGRERCYSVTVVFNTPAARFKQKLGARVLELRVFVELLQRWSFHARLKTYPDARAGVKT